MAQLVAPVLPPDYNPIETLFKGYAAVASINNHRRQLELATGKLAVANEAAEWKHRIDMEKLSRADEKLESMDRHYRATEDVNKIVEQRKLLQVEKSVSQAKADNQRLIEMQGKIYNIKEKPGTTPYQQALDEVRNEFSDVTGTADARRIFTPIESRHKTARSEAYKSFTNQVAALGVDPWKASTIFTTPQMVQGADDEKGNMTFQMGLDKNNQPVVAKIPKKKYDELKSLYHEFNDYGAAKVVTDDHLTEWKRAKTALSKFNPVQVKEMYKTKGFDPSELDSDTPP